MLNIRLFLALFLTSFTAENLEAAVVGWGIAPTESRATAGRMEIVREFALPRCFRPVADFAPQVSEELQTAPKPLTRLNLQNKPLLFATQDSIFNPAIAHAFIGSLPRELEILDLSMNRLPSEALAGFSELLKRPNFRFLDVRVNSGANSVDALRQLATALAGEDVSSLLAKIIWVDRGVMENLKTKGILKERYYRAHLEYYGLFSEQAERWEMPD